jgi:outer membrane immunogenic protein
VLSTILNHPESVGGHLGVDMKTRIAAAVGAVMALAITGPAIAADMSTPILKAPPVVTVFTWTGCYVGGHGGGVWVRKDWERTFAGTPTVLLGSHDANGWLGGGQVGCNYQPDRWWVFGIQADYAWAEANGSHTDLSVATLTDYSRVRSLGSVTGRIGFAAWDRFMFYGKGGWAWERDNHLVSGTIPILVGGVPVTVPLSQSANLTRGGWTVGVGGEFAFSQNWSAFVEYDYYDFGKRTVAFTSDLAGGLVLDGISIRERKYVGKFGINYRFGGDTVVAKY